MAVVPNDTSANPSSNPMAQESDDPRHESSEDLLLQSIPDNRVDDENTGTPPHAITGNHINSREEKALSENENEGTLELTGKEGDEGRAGASIIQNEEENAGAINQDLGNDADKLKKKNKKGRKRKESVRFRFEYQSVVSAFRNKAFRKSQQASIAWSIQW